MMLALCFVGVFVFIVRYLFSNKYGILYLLVECMKLPTIQQIKDEWQLVLFLILLRYASWRLFKNGIYDMKRILPILALLIFISGCGVNQNTNNGNTESNTKSSSESTQDSSKMANLDNYLTAAKQALSVGDYNKAIEESTVAIKANANNAEAYSIRGFATALNGDTTKGLVDTKKAYDLDPNNVANYYNMAMVYKLQGQLQESKRWFEKVLEKDPSNTWSVYGIATIYADQGDDTKALDWLEKAINIDASVKAVAAEQDHFERFHNNARFKTLVGL